MSRLDSFIRRLEAQRACLNRAAALISGIDGIVLELGLGNGRTYDHLRELFADRDIYVCERRVAAHPACVPPPEFLILGDMRETLPGLGSRFGGRVALAHFDAGTGDRTGNLALAAELTPVITRAAVPRRRAGQRPADRGRRAGTVAAAGRGLRRSLSSLPPKSVLKTI